ncbi:MAG TPA: toll/interleukin-1 receptor domain-containing protein [Pyrinomonadaceae bacterium]|nr:toll/interleukin-1 receptor domain-containing protein [Pyrinomonadaceae bacterium]
MILLDTLTVYYGSEERLIELYKGDLTDLKPEEAVDVLVVSAFPNDYIPTPTSLIGALYRKGVSVEQLARSKAVDLRQTFSCWMSQDVVAPSSGIQFKRILCFESSWRGTPPSVVGDIFRALAPLLGGEPPISTVAMPIVASGDQGYGISEMLPPLIDGAVHWMALGLPLKRLKIVAHSDFQAAEARELFAELKKKHLTPPFESKQDSKYDVFISYAHEDMNAATLIAQELQSLEPSIRIFMDRMSLNIGAAWQPEIFEAIDACRKVLVLFSPSYLSSKVCKEEFNIAWVRGREADEDCVFPVYLYSASLPTYMKYRLYIDCREGDKNKLLEACSNLLSALSKPRPDSGSAAA